jgi:hypothetical protein
MLRCDTIAWKILLAWAGLLVRPTDATAQVGIIIEGIADAEFWATDDASRLLARNAGQPEMEFNVNLWSAVQLHPTLFVYALGTFSGVAPFGNGEVAGDADVTQLTLRYTISPAFMSEVGKIESPLGTFASRRLSNRNPLIGMPDAYPTSYPWGVKVGGAWNQVDYRAGLVSLPAVNERYVPEFSHRLRPVFGAGFTVTPNVRVGSSVTWGPYLGTAVQDVLPSGSSWPDFNQWIVAFDARFGVGHLATYAEIAFSGYDIPGREESQDGYAYYIEATYSLHPRLFASGRFEQNNYPFIRPIDATNWRSVTTNFYNAEAGIGYRASRRTTLKVSYRRDEWPFNPNSQVTFENGYAIAVQFSHHFDVMSLLDR